MTIKTVSIDAGNGFTNALLADDRRKTYEHEEPVNFPSVRAMVSGDTLGDDYQHERKIEYAIWNGHRYAVGDDIQFSTNPAEHLQGKNRYGTEHHQFLIAYALRLLGMKQATVDLTLFAPPKLFEQARAQMNAALADNHRKLHIQLRSDPQRCEYDIHELNVRPEGLAALLCFALDSEGVLVAPDILQGNTIVIDAGMYTLDTPLIEGMQFNPETLATSTHESGGIRRHVLQPVLRSVQQNGGEDFSLLTVDDIDRVLRKGLQTGDYTLTAGRKSMNIQAQFLRYGKTYAGWIANNVLETEYNGLRGIANAIIVGGGEHLIASHLRDMYGSKIVNPDNYSHVQGIPATLFNAVGGLRAAKRQAAKA